MTEGRRLFQKLSILRVHAGFDRQGLVCGPLDPGAAVQGISSGDLVNHGSVTRSWYEFPGLTGRFDPGLFGLFHLLQGLLRSFTESGAGIQIRNISDIAAILFAIKDVDMVVAH